MATHVPERPTIVSPPTPVWPDLTLRLEGTEQYERSLQALNATLAESRRRWDRQLETVADAFAKMRRTLEQSTRGWGILVGPLAQPRPRPELEAGIQAALEAAPGIEA